MAFVTTEVFSDKAVDNLRITSFRSVAYPHMLMEDVPLSETAKQNVVSARAAVENVFSGEDDRLVVVLGPPMLHDVAALKEFAGRLAAEGRRFELQLVLCVRARYEQAGDSPQAWTGFARDPEMDGTFNVNKGLRLTRQLLVELNAMGVPVSASFADAMLPQYLADTLSHVVIDADAARAKHFRELSSALSMPVGLHCEGTHDASAAAEALADAGQPHNFMSISKLGLPVMVFARGNKTCHVVVPSAEDNGEVAAALERRQVKTRRMVVLDTDEVTRDLMAVVQRVSAGDSGVAGVAMNAFLLAGAQDVVVSDRQSLRYGVGVGGTSLGWGQVVGVLEQLAKAVDAKRQAGLNATTA